jgi:hypothetical protein
MLLMIFGLVVGSVATAESKRKPQRTTRTIEGSYASPAIFLYGSCSASDGVGCVSFTTGPNERFVTAEVADEHGLPVFVLIRNEQRSPAEGAETYGTFCGKTTEPIAVPPGRDLQFWVGAPFAVAGCQPGAGTTGTVTATFSNLP